MKRLISLNQLFVVLLTVLSLLGLQSCNRDDDPIKPTNEVTDKGHEEWSKVTFKFTKGHLHGKNFHGDPINPEIKYFKSVQEISYEVDEKGDLKVSTDQPIRFIKDTQYALEITYYNKKGEAINGEFVTAEMAPIHQHFFMAKNIKTLEGKGVEKPTNTLLDYLYRDTNPWDQMFRFGGQLRDEKDPIGLKGYFTIKEKYLQYDLNVVLVHVIKGSKLDDNGNPYPFYNPSKRILGVQDLNIKIPVRVYGEHPGGDSTGYTSEDLVKDIAKEFNISYDEAFDDWDKSFDAPHDSSKYWM
ncbi:hypothetical protein [Riemerella columbina]|uniref:hypothetical protein n=1 Tax=Riemerella columbina TaxID=103810 RepID=UPI0003AA9DD1|nr:hypothetical protein [Riemerella columbina]